MPLDFETSAANKGSEMSLKQAEDFVALVKQRIGRYPMLYGGAWLRDQVGTSKNEVLAQCPLWYRRYAKAPIGLPTQIWPTYTLWQYTDGQVSYGAGAPIVVDGLGCDTSYFQGSADDLRAKWPFTHR